MDRLRRHLATAVLAVVLLAGLAAGAARATSWDPRFGYPGVQNGASPGQVLAVAAAGSSTYIGGSFNTVGGIRPAANIARWTGSQFVALGSGVNGQVDAIAVSGPDVYVAGNFTTAGGLSSPGVAMWNGSSWVALGGALTTGANPGTGYALAVIGSHVFVGGSFDHAGGVAAKSIAYWDGTNWNDVGGVSHISLSPTVYALQPVGTDLYVAGLFTSAGTPATNANSIAVFHTTTGSWGALGSGLAGGAGVVRALTLDPASSVLYAGGNFNSAGGQPAGGVARWPLSSNGPWSAVGSLMTSGTDNIYALSVRSGSLYAGGSFSTGDGAPANSLAEWNGTSWSAVGSLPLAGSVNALGLDSTGALVVAGAMTNIGLSNQPTFFYTDGIARWTGTSWKTLGLGVFTGPCDFAPYCGEVLASAVDGLGHLYVAGEFVQGGATHAVNVAEWNGAQWVTLGPAFDGVVTAMTFANGNLYVGGAFAHIGSLAANGIATWNPSTRQWSALGSGITGGPVRALAADNGYLYVGGAFSDVGGLSEFDFARWQLGATSNAGWYRPSNPGFDSTTAVNAIAIANGFVILGGHFTFSYTTDTACASAGQTAVSGLFIWSEATSGFDFFWGCGAVNTPDRGTPTVDALLIEGSDVYVGGNFDELDTGSAQSPLIKGVSGVAMMDTGTLTWSKMAGGVTGGGARSVYALALSGTTLYLGGQFTGTVSGLTRLGSIAAWDTAAAAFSALSSGMQCGYGTADCPNTVSSIPAVDTLAIASPWLWAGGRFTRAQHNPAANISRWG